MTIYRQRASTWQGFEYRDDHLLAKGQHREGSEYRDDHLLAKGQYLGQPALTTRGVVSGNAALPHELSYFTATTVEVTTMHYCKVLGTIIPDYEGRGVWT